VSVDQGRGVGNLEVVPDRRVRESTHVVYGNGFVRIVSRHDQSGIRPLVVGFGTRLESLASDLEGAVGVASGVNRERGVPPRFVLDGGIEPDEEQPRDARQVSFLEPVCDLLATYVVHMPRSRESVSSIPTTVIARACTPVE